MRGIAVAAALFRWTSPWRTFRGGAYWWRVHDLLELEHPGSGLFWPGVTDNEPWHAQAGTRTTQYVPVPA